MAPPGRTTERCRLAAGDSAGLPGMRSSRGAAVPGRAAMTEDEKRETATRQRHDWQCFAVSQPRPAVCDRGSFSLVGTA